MGSDEYQSIKSSCQRWHNKVVFYRDMGVLLSFRKSLHTTECHMDQEFQGSIQNTVGQLMDSRTGAEIVIPALK